MAPQQAFWPAGQNLDAGRIYSARADKINGAPARRKPGGGGDGGGYVVCTGTPEEVAACAASYTGQYLKRVL